MRRTTRTTSKTRRATGVAAGLALALGALAAPRASAHEFWIEPSAHAARERGLVSVKLRVGEDGVGEAVRRDDAKIERFEAVSDDGTAAVRGLDGADPAGA